ncbi:MAG TPA: amidohydrolase family protein [Allosphingosinicella sp.]|jgi:imidazolonepropionase-like amidohydrolase
MKADSGGGILSRLLVISSALPLLGCASVQTPPSGGTLIRNVTVIPMDKPGSLRARDVLIADGRIAAVVRSGTLRGARAAHVIEGRGKYLLPGLWDMHVHALTGVEQPSRETLPLYLANGIVGVRDLGSTLEELAAARSASAPEALPQLVGTGPLLDGPRQPWMQKMALPLATAEEAGAAATRLADAGVDFLKVYNNLSADRFAAVAAVGKERGLPLVGHVPFKLSLEHVSAAGQKSVEHAGLQLVKDCIPHGQKAVPAALNAWIRNGYPGRFEETRRWWAKRDQAACAALYRRMAERGTWVTPMLVNEVKGGRWTRPEDLARLPERLRKACEGSLESIDSAPAARDEADRLVFDLVRELHAAGVPLLAGSDVPNECLWHGSSLHKELEMMVHAGLSPWDALATATRNPARFLGRPDEGAIREGAVANLLLLDGNPLEDISNTRRIAGVMLKGRWHDAATRLSAGDAIIYENAAVWTGRGFERRTLAVRQGRFVDPSEAAPGAERLDLSGRFVVPAYGNAHAHLTSPTPKQSWSFLEQGVFYVWNPNTIIMDDAALRFYARKDSFDVRVSQGGITEPGGHPEYLYVEQLSKWAYKGKTLKDFLGNAFHYGRDRPEIDASLDRLKRQKADFVKAYLLNSEDYARRRDDSKFYGEKGLNPVNLPYLVTAARQRGLFVAVHVETVSDLKVAALSGAAVAAHLPAYGVRTEDDLKRRTLTQADAALVAKSGMLLVPTYSIAARGDDGTSSEAEKAFRKRVLAVQARNIRLLKEAGAKFLIGTDGTGEIFEEVEHLVKIGALSREEALEIALATGGKLFPQRRIGCFEPGCEADFLVLSADPSNDISALRKIEARIKAGVEQRAPVTPEGASPPRS